MANARQQQQQQDRRSRLRRPHVYEDVETAEAPPIMPAFTSDSHARTRSWVESHNERLWASEEVQRSDSAEGHHRGDRLAGSMWASKNREVQQQRGGAQQQRGGAKERRQQPRMTRLGRSGFAPPPMTVESDVLGPAFHSSRTASLPNAHLAGMGETPSSRRLVPPPTTSSTTAHQGRSKRISYGIAVGDSPIDLPNKDIPMRDVSHTRTREPDRGERFSSSDHYASRMRARAREEPWQTEGYGGSRSHTHGMYNRRYNSAQRQVSPPQYPAPHQYQSSRRSSESSGDGYGGGYNILQESVHEHYSRYGGGSHGDTRSGRIVPQRTYSNDLPHQRIEGVGPTPVTNRESYL